MNIHAYVEAEKEEVLRILPESFKEQPVFNVYMNSGTFDEGVPNIFMVEENDEVIGVMRMRKHAFHPYAIYLGMSVKGDANEYVPKLIRYVEEIKKDNLPIIIRENEVYPSCNIYEQCGFDEMRRTYEAMLQEVPVMNEEGIYPYHVVSLEDNVLTLEQTMQLVRLMKHCYTVTHRDNPVGEFDDARWGTFLDDEDIVKGASYVALDGERVAAYVFAHDDGEGIILELGWSGRRDEVNQQVITMLTKHQIAYACHHEYEKVMFVEVDNTDFYAYPLLNDLQFDVSNTMITWKKGERV
jgi:hypothetical protein